MNENQILAHLLNRYISRVEQYCVYEDGWFRISSKVTQTIRNRRKTWVLERLKWFSDNTTWSSDLHTSEIFYRPHQSSN